MTLTLRQIYEMAQPLKKLLAQDVPIRAAYRLSKTVKIVDEEYGLIEAKRNELVRKYGATDEEEPDKIKVQQDNLQDYLRDLTEYLSTETELAIKPIKVSELGDISVSTQDMLALEGILEDDE